MVREERHDAVQVVPVERPEERLQRAFCNRRRHIPFVSVRTIIHIYMQTAAPYVAIVCVGDLRPVTL
jgi:hypothetical protein